MTVPWPRGEDQQQAGVGPGRDRVALAGVELEEVPGVCRHGLAAKFGDVDLAVDDDEPRPVVHLVLLQLLPRREVQHDRSRVVGRGQDLRLMWLCLDGLQIPALHVLVVSGPVPTDQCARIRADMTRLAATILFATLALVAAGCGGSSSGDSGSSTVPVRLQAALSGEQSVLGKGMLKGAQLAAAQLNSNGGIPRENGAGVPVRQSPAPPPRGEKGENTACRRPQR